MKLQSFNSPAAPQPPWGGYSQALLATGASRFLFVSGQVPETADGSVPADFAGQCRLAWANVRAQLREAGMDLTPALTVVIPGLFEARWLLEIEAIAAD
jgi:2-iminobutanoate/2-iminopropanoate deaminase